MKRDDSCVMQVNKDIPSMSTCASCPVFWLDDNMLIHHILRRDYVLSRRYCFQEIDEMSRLARPDVKVAALERRMARNVHGGVDGSLAIFPKISRTHSRMQVRMCRLPRPANCQNLFLSSCRVQLTLEPFLSRSQAGRARNHDARQIFD